MNDLYDWALRNRVPMGAMQELFAMFNVHGGEGQPVDRMTGRSEAAVQNNIRLEASRVGARLWRNNVGGDHKSGLRWGLANDTPAVNKVLKSSDLIGIRPVMITPEHVGSVLGQFVAREVKEEGWVYTGTEHEAAQFNFIKLVSALGGDACFANKEGTL